MTDQETPAQLRKRHLEWERANLTPREYKAMRAFERRVKRRAETAQMTEGDMIEDVLVKTTIRLAKVLPKKTRLAIEEYVERTSR